MIFKSIYCDELSHINFLMKRMLQYNVDNDTGTKASTWPQSWSEKAKKISQRNYKPGKNLKLSMI